MMIISTSPLSTVISQDFQLEKERERLSLSKSESSIFDWPRNSIEARSMSSVLSKGNQLVDVNQNEVIFRPFFQFQMDDSKEE